MVEQNTKVGALLLEERDWATVLWALAAVSGLEKLPATKKILDSVPKMSKQEPKRGEELKALGQKLAMEADIQFNMKKIGH